MTAILSAKDVYRFRDADGEQIPILRGITLDVGKGEFASIMGPSGSGKSTLLHILAGLDTCSAGDVELVGTKLSECTESVRTRLRRQNVGFIFQFFNLLPDLTVEENVVLPLMIAGERPERSADHVAELLTLLGIAELKTRLPSGLSGGEMQRVSIARALVTKPPIVFADEPTGNLSSKAGEEIVALLRNVVERLGTSLLLVTHNPRDAAAGDRVLFLHDGSLDLDQALTGGGFHAADVFRRLEELGI